MRVLYEDGDFSICDTGGNVLELRYKDVLIKTGREYYDLMKELGRNQWMLAEEFAEVDLGGYFLGQGGHLRECKVLGIFRKHDAIFIEADGLKLMTAKTEVILQTRENRALARKVNYMNSKVLEAQEKATKYLGQMESFGAYMFPVPKKDKVDSGGGKV